MQENATAVALMLCGGCVPFQVILGDKDDNVARSLKKWGFIKEISQDVHRLLLMSARGLLVMIKNRPCRSDLNFSDL